MKSCNWFNGFVGNQEAKDRIAGWLDAGCFPHAVIITAEEGYGRNYFATLTAQAYLEDTTNKTLRGIHPDFLVVEGEGASGNIPVKAIRRLSYDLNMAAVETNGRRVALLKDVKNLNNNSANALLKILEEPPEGIVFLLTAVNADSVIATIRSRCVTVALAPLSPEESLRYFSKKHPDYVNGRLQELCNVYDGRIGAVQDTLELPERLALYDCATRLCAAALKGDKLAMLIELECASKREELKCILFDTLMHLKKELRQAPEKAKEIYSITQSLTEHMQDIDRYVNLKLLATHMVAVI